MTPRALLTAISGTAVAFALAIGFAAGSSPSRAEPTATVAATTQTTTPAQPEVALYTLAADQNCPVAL